MKEKSIKRAKDEEVNRQGAKGVPQPHTGYVNIIARTSSPSNISPRRRALVNCSCNF